MNAWSTRSVRQMALPLGLWVKPTCVKAAVVLINIHLRHRYTSRISILKTKMYNIKFLHVFPNCFAQCHLGNRQARPHHYDAWILRQPRHMKGASRCLHNETWALADYWWTEQTITSVAYLKLFVCLFSRMAVTIFANVTWNVSPATQWNMEFGNDCQNCSWKNNGTQTGFGEVFSLQNFYATDHAGHTQYDYTHKAK